MPPCSLADARFSLELPRADVLGQHSRASLEDLEKTKNHTKDLYAYKIASGGEQFITQERSSCENSKVGPGRSKASQIGATLGRHVHYRQGISTREARDAG